MVNIDLKKLLTISPIEQKTKDRLFGLIDKMDEDSMFDLETLCWESIAEMIDLDYTSQSAKLNQEIEEGKRKYNANDFTEVKVRIIYNIAEKLQMAETENQLALVRSKIEQHKKVS